MDDFITVHDLLNQLLGFLLVHAPHFLNTCFISFLEAFELVLEILEDVGVILVVSGHPNINLLVLCLLLQELSFLISYSLHNFAFALFEVIRRGLVDLLPLSEHCEIESKLLVVQLEDGLHVLHALFEGLHLLFKLNFLVSLIVGVLASELFQFLSIFLHLACLVFGEVAFGLTVLLEELFNLF